MQKTFSRSNINLHNVLYTIAIILATIYLAIVIYIIASRIDYKYHLEWMEGVSLVQVYRIIQGQSIYVSASLEFVPTIYPPLYFYLAALVATLTGIRFLPLRLVSVAATLGCMIVIYLAVKNKTNSTWIGFISIGIFAATFRAGGAWFDIGRVDMLFVFLSLCGIYLSGKTANWKATLAGIFFALSFLTKQTVTPILAATFISILISSPKRALYFILSFGMSSVLAYLIINRLTNGWYEFYIFILPAANRIIWSDVPNLLTKSFETETVLFIIGCLPFLLNPCNVMRDRLYRHYYLTIGAMIIASAMGIIYPGAYDNAAIPAYAGLSILSGLGISWLSSFPIQNIRTKEISLIVLWLAVCIQFIQLKYNPQQQIPTQNDLKAGNALVSELSAVPGNILIPYHNYLALFAGKKIYFNIIAYDQLAGLYSHKSLNQLNGFKKELNSTSFDVIVMDNNKGPFNKTSCLNTSQIQYSSDNTFIPVTGWLIRPTTIYTQCP